MIVLGQIFVGLMTFLLVSSSAFWTYWIYANAIRHDRELSLAVRLCVPVGFTALLLVCYLFYGALTLFSRQLPETGHFDWGVFVSIIMLGVVFFTKNLVAPLVLGLTASWALFQYVVHDQVGFLPIYAMIVETLLFWAPHWLQDSYVWGSLGTYFFTTTAGLAR